MRVCWWKLSVHIILCCYLIFIQFPPSCLVDTCRYRCRHHRHNHHCHRICTWSVFSIKNLSHPKAKWIFNKMGKKDDDDDHNCTWTEFIGCFCAWALQSNLRQKPNQTKWMNRNNHVLSYHISAENQISRIKINPENIIISVRHIEWIFHSSIIFNLANKTKRL